MIGAMWKATVLLVLLMLSSGGDGLFRTLYKSVQASRPHKGNVGRPLFLTPYIKAGKLKEGKFNQKTTGILSTLFLFFLKQLPCRIPSIFWYFYSLVLFQILVI